MTTDNRQTRCPAGDCAEGVTTEEAAAIREDLAWPYRRCAVCDRRLLDVLGDDVGEAA